MIHEVPLTHVTIQDAFWSARQRLMIDKTLPYMEKILRDEIPDAAKSHAIENFRIAAGDAEGAFYGMVFQDSDVAKWLEAVSYSLAVKPDSALEKRMDEVIDIVSRAQRPDGYLDTYFILKEPDKRWSNLMDCHELYCAGHMIEAAVACYESTGKATLLRVAEKLAAHIIDRFGEGKEEGIPGHQEIELALMRLYRATGKAEYRDMAKRFLDLRGQDPAFFTKQKNAVQLGQDNAGYQIDPFFTAYNQSDVPVREQVKARGHAVRQVYMLTGMADVAAACGDAEMAAACVRMFDHITQRQMYVTGNVGSAEHYESFTDDFDLPNDLAYGETCASVAMAFFAKKLWALDLDGRYADLLELELFNGALAGMDLQGERYFYVNALEVDPALSKTRATHKHVLPVRPRWHACACCPPNLARLITSLGGYLWSEEEGALYSHLFVGSESEMRLASVKLETGYPWEGSARYTLTTHTSEAFTLAIHIPGYVKDVSLTLNGLPCAFELRKGYAFLKREWHAGDVVSLSFALLPRRLYADPRVKADAGRVALARGPLVYCFEGVDNGEPLSALRLPREAVIEAAPYNANLLGGIVALTMPGMRTLAPDHGLYADSAPREEPASLTAIPYYAWANRGENQMCVWIRE